MLHRAGRCRFRRQRRQIQAAQLLQQILLALQLAAQLLPKGREGIEVELQAFTGGLAQQADHGGLALILQQVDQDRAPFSFRATEQGAELEDQLTTRPALEQQRDGAALQIEGLPEDLLQVAAGLGIQQVEPRTELRVGFGLHSPGFQLLKIKRQLQPAEAHQ